MTDQPFLPRWVTETLANDAQARAERIERIFGPDAAAEGYEIAADLRAINREDTA